ncbi:MAG: apolipoprotein N-acyltransferase [Parachlamydiales bacterium]|jgi:apolipoprotein N-acyltransferase
MRTLGLLLLGWIVCAFGQPPFSSWLALIAGAGGYACILKALLDVQDPKKRFFVGAGWFAAVQAVQFFWFLSHPFLYIYAVYVFIISIYALQFGLLSLYVTPNYLRKRWIVLAIPSFWFVMEWSRLFIFSGVSFNPLGLALSANIYSLQMASVVGVMGLSFWVLLTAVLLARQNYYLWSIAAVFPFLFGAVHLQYHSNNELNVPTMNALLVQTAFPVEESLEFHSTKAFLDFVLGEWDQILKITSPHKDESFDVVALPEMVVPFGAYMLAYPYEKAIGLFRNTYGNDVLAYLPLPNPPFGDEGYVNNAFFVQSLSNIFRAPVLSGMEDIDYLPNGERVLFSAALLFSPLGRDQEPRIERYEKRILVPMGEYIPFAAVAELARSYGITGSFTPGQEAKVMQCGRFTIAPSICYDETFGALTKDGCAKGAQVLINVTNDAWFPAITRQHMEHARLRTVEGGIPLLRACNTGVTCAMDSFGKTISELGEGHSNPAELSASLSVKVPVYNYTTFYSHGGDLPLLIFSIMMSAFLLTRIRFI